MDRESVSIATLAKHHGVYRWILEVQSAGRFARLWGQVGESNLSDKDKVTVTNVIWALAAFERAQATLEENAARVESIQNEGPIPAMALLSGPYGPKSMEYVLVTSLWHDLADALVWYRAIKDRLRLLEPSAQRGQIALTHEEWKREVKALEDRRLAEFGGREVTLLAGELLHKSWHPTTPDLSIDLYWTGDEGERTLNFTETGDVRASVRSLLQEAVEQLEALAPALRDLGGVSGVEMGKAPVQ